MLMMVTMETRMFSFQISKDEEDDEFILGVGEGGGWLTSKHFDIRFANHKG